MPKRSNVRFCGVTTVSTIYSLNMTSSINFTDLCQKMELLKELHAETERLESGEQRQRYIDLRREVSRKLLPLFADLEETNMLMYWIRKENYPSLKRAIKTGNECFSLGELGEACENSGIQLSLMD